MKINQLEAFYWIARLGSFAMSAKVLHTTQPAISQRVRELERRLGAKLFDTSSRRATITSKGHELFIYAEQVLNLISTIEARMGDASTLSGHIHVGATETVALTWLPDLVSRVDKKYPNVVLELDIGLTMELWDKLAAGLLDVAILPGPALGLGMEADPVGCIDYQWMASPKLGIPKGPLSLKDLEPFPIISLPKASTLHDDIERWFRTNGVQLKRTSLCNSLGVVSALTMAGIGISLLPPEIYAAAIERGDLYALEVEPIMPALHFSVVYSQKHVSPLPLLVAKVAREVTTFRSN